MPFFINISIIIFFIINYVKVIFFTNDKKKVCLPTEKSVVICFACSLFLHLKNLGQNYKLFNMQFFIACMLANSALLPTTGQQEKQSCVYSPLLY